MLREISIRNFAIIDTLTIRFHEGLNVITGETGAGKSIIVDALSLVLGSRAQTDFIRTGEKELVIQAYFEIAEEPQLPDIGIDLSDGLLIRRIVSSAGKSRAFINDTMVNLQTLAEFGSILVDIHGQHEHQSLMSVDTQRRILDTFGKLDEDREKVGELFKQTEQLKEEISDLSRQTRERADKADLLRFQVMEIDGASLQPGEKERLLQEKTILANISRLKELTETAYGLLYDSEGSCTEKLSSVLAKVKELSLLDPGTAVILNMLEAASPLIEDATLSLRKYRGSCDTDIERIQSVEERLEEIRRLERKYGEGIETVILYRNKAAGDLQLIEQTDSQLDKLVNNLQELESELVNSARILSDKRKAAASEIELLVKKELRELSFSSSDFQIEIRQDTITSSGYDRIEFLFSANPGETAKPLNRVASGGELSRIMLALKNIFAAADRIPTLVFDEIDAGIGGKTALAVGNSLKKVAQRHQVLCTTHLPQIAAKASSHLKIEKALDGERAKVDVHELSGSKRMDEIARMLSGTISNVSLRHAEELIKSTA
jgi:DNA repair protein RecN (Recombination protein N)